MKNFNRNGAVAMLVAVVIVMIITAAAAAWMLGGDQGAGSSGEPGGSASEGRPSPSTGSTSAPGTTSDIYGRQVVTPAGDVAQPLGQAGESADRCMIEPAVTIQTTYGAQTLWSQSSGPSTVTGGVPTGYSKDATGAALAGWNYRAAMFAGGDVSRAAVHHHLDFGAKQVDIEHMVDTEDFVRDDGMLGLLVPDAVRVTTCKDDFIVIEMAHRVFGDESGRIDELKWDIMRFTMKWADGGWKLDVPAMAQSGDVITTLDGWVKWQF